MATSLALPLAPLDADDRADLLRAHGAGPAEVAELLAYGANRFEIGADALTQAYPPPDEPFVDAWLGYEREAERIGVAECLRRRLIQLQFPIVRGMSERDDYLAAVRRGVRPLSENGVQFVRPDGLRLFLHSTPAGRLPVIVAAERKDFSTLVCALTRRNEPDVIPDSMGACIVAGYNNWDRVAQLRAAWEATNPSDASDSAWTAEWKRLMPDTSLYRDRFVVLSAGPYSATAASDLGLDDQSWLRSSVTLRLEHECAHYFTRRVFGAMQNSLLDELIADYAGIVTAAEQFRSEWLLRFMGLESYPAYRPGGRLQNYRGTPPLSDAAFVVLQSMLVHAAANLERFDAALAAAHARRSMADCARVIMTMAAVGLERLAAPGGDAVLLRTFDDLAHRRNAE